MIGQTIAHYRVTAKLGAGGMGEVYRATDSKLGRDVALKVLPAEMANDPQRLARFQREARAVAALNHPHIVTIYSVEEAGGVHFLTMELVEGQPLSRCIPGSGLQVAQLAEMAIALADALAAAHEKGIVHRDLKPANVMVANDGRVKVLDFGLAKETRAASDSEATLSSAGHTEAGMVMGTPAYMSPEQVAGRLVDHRTDIFSLGILLYEMATGKRPFAGASSAELASAILRDAASLVTDVRAELPSDLARIIRRCLEKEPRHRIQTARDVANEFRDLSRTASSQAVAPAAASGPVSMVRVTDSGSARAEEELWVAVLPFKSAGGDAEVEELANGLTEDITAGLSRFSYLRVVARNSTLQFQGRAVDLRTVAKELNARYVMDGGLRRSGATVRVSVQLVDTATGAHLWAETYDRELAATNALVLQDEITTKIVSTVGDSHGVLPRVMAALVKRKPADSITPCEAVMRQFHYYQMLTAEEHLAVRTLLERAVEQAPDFADAWASLALMILDEHKQGYNVQPDPLGRATTATGRALALDPANQLAHYSQATALFFQKDFDAFRHAAQRALALNPFDGSTRAWMGLLIAYSGEWDRGIALVDEALQMNPYHPGWYRFGHYWKHFRNREFQEALNAVRMINMPGYPYYHAALAAVCGHLDRSEEARRALQELLRLAPHFRERARGELGKWLSQEYVDLFLEGLRKAGLEIPDSAVCKVETPRSEHRAIRSQSGLSGAAHEQSSAAVVVLPFVNRSPDTGNEYFSDGLTEEIISNLSRIEALRVISRNSSMALKGTAMDTGSIAKQLGVTHIVSGSVRRAGDALRVTAELVEAASDTPVWSDNYSGTVADVFGIQEEIARKIASALKIKLTDSGAHAAAHRPIGNVVAYDCYLRARQELYGWTHESQERAARLVDQGLGIVGENPLLLATKGQIIWNRVNVMMDPAEGDLDEAADCARRALLLDPEDFLGIFLRGLVEGLRGNTAGALRDFRRAHQLRPGDPNVIAEMCRFAHASGVDVNDEVEELVRIDPLTPVTWLLVAFNQHMNGRIPESVPAARKVLELAREVSLIHIIAAWVFARAGLREDSIEVLEKAAKKLHATLHGSWALFLRHALDGDAETCRTHVTPLLEQCAGRIDHVACTIADGYSLIGQNDNALKWIRNGMNRGFINYPFLAVHNPLLANVRSDPRYPELMREAKARWEALGRNLPQTLRLVTSPRDLA
jgi:TolB-like protein